MCPVGTDQWPSGAGLGPPRSRVASWDEARAGTGPRDFHPSVTVEHSFVFKVDGGGFQMRSTDNQPQ